MLRPIFNFRGIFKQINDFLKCKLMQYKYCFYTHIITIGGGVLNKIYDIAIIGGGTAGMTSAIYGCRAGKKVVIIEKSIYGGQIISSAEVENYPAFSPATGYDFAIELHQQICDLDVEQINDEVRGVKKARTLNKNLWCIELSSSTLLSESIIIATGTESRSLNLPEEKKYIGHGLSYCAVCDGAFHKNKTTAVVGGGNTALEEALYLSLLCEKVYLIQRGTTLTAEETLIDSAMKKQNITILLNTEVTRLCGNNMLERIELVSGNNSFDLNISGLFIAIGRIPQNKIFSNLVMLDSEGYIIAYEDCHTNIPGILAAGDCRTKALRQLVTAASDGARASSEALKYLNDNRKNIEL